MRVTFKSPGASTAFIIIKKKKKHNNKTLNSDILATEDAFYNYSWFPKQLMNYALERMWQHPGIYTHYGGGTKMQFITD